VPPPPGFGAVPGEVTKLMSTGNASQRVNGALVVVAPGSDKAMTFAQYREQHFATKKKPKREDSRWGPVLAEEPDALRGRTLAYRTRIDQLSSKMESLLPVELPPVAERSPSPPPQYDPVSGLR
jgi:hypothetical protein